MFQQPYNLLSLHVARFFDRWDIDPEFREIFVINEIGRVVFD
jgi:hypothetical protein